MIRRKLLMTLLATPLAVLAGQQPKSGRKRVITKEDLRKAKATMATIGVRPLSAGYYELRTSDPHTVLDWPIWDDLKVSRTALTEGCHLMPGIWTKTPTTWRFSLVGETVEDKRVNILF